MLPNILKLITTLLAVLGLWVGYVKLVRPWREARRARVQATRRYDQLFTPADGVCFSCHEPGADTYDEDSKRWYHQRCAKALVHT